LKVILKRCLVAILALSVLFALVGCNIHLPGTVSGSGKTQVRDFDLSGFTGIQAGSAFTLQVNRADVFKVQVTADDNLWDSLDIIKNGNTLRLGTKSGVLITNANLQAVVSLPALSSLDLSGAARASLTSFSSDSDLSYVLSGASSANLNNLKSGKTIFDLSGASSVSGSVIITDGQFTLTGASKANLSGSGTSASLDASGASSAILDQLKLQDVTLTLSGASQARVNSQKISSADLSGASHLNYVGTPVMGKIQTSGGSGISQQ
jgi:hypothetical protein